MFSLSRTCCLLKKSVVYAVVANYRIFLCKINLVPNVEYIEKTVIHYILREA